MIQDDPAHHDHNDQDRNRNQEQHQQHRKDLSGDAQGRKIRNKDQKILCPAGHQHLQKRRQPDHKVIDNL